MQCVPFLGDWAIAPWLELGFAMTVPFRHQYSYIAGDDGSGVVATATATATGDLDCDGNLSTFTLTCTVVGNAPSCVITVPPIID